MKLKTKIVHSRDILNSLERVESLQVEAEIYRRLAGSSDERIARVEGQLSIALERLGSRVRDIMLGRAIDRKRLKKP